ncbi:hypothetical protein [Candidatus Uabimicrobium amorphum]|uniref:EcxA zinc-binding domain-containing protein n=1 Tax=Uabimicrobium amorphum TaxID=2596890 RepID=A0A5S9IN06_UABAM|nr:hypothetical protein [Candidatus Uabimicrobium amorphum]BBM84520.1 hypothetical protein UABAM_02881 [Candidatus Uabimicrobium amorphum]
MKNLLLIFVVMLSSLVFCQSEFEQTYFQGKWKPSNEAIKNTYALDEIGDFGTFVIDEEGKKIRIPDLLYSVKLGKGSSNLGIRAIPVKDHEHDFEIVVDEEGFVRFDYNKQYSDFKWGNGSQLIDEHLQSIMFDGQKNEELFALIGYTHPESQDNEYLTEGRISHMGVYIGDGETRHSPYDYDPTWGAIEYPVNVYTVSLRGVSQRALNANFRITTRLLNETNEGPRFPEDYTFDWFRTHNLEELLAFYRGWIDPTYVRRDLNERLMRAGVAGVDLDTPYQHIISTEQFLQTYCSEHMTIIVNIAINLPQTKKGYQEIWGEEEGARLFTLANELWVKMTGENIPQEIVSSFDNPLWKRRLGFSNDILINNPKIRETAFAFAWKPQTTADLLGDFVGQYASFDKVSVVRSVMSILSFAPEIQKRTGVSAEKYMELSLLFIDKMFKHHFRLFSAQQDLRSKSKEAQQAVSQQYFAQLKGIFANMLQEQPEVLFLINQKLDETQQSAFSLIENQVSYESFNENSKTITEILRLKIEDKYALSLGKIAWIQFLVDSHKKNIVVIKPDGSKSLESLMNIARNAEVKLEKVVDQAAAGSKFVKFYSPPAIAHRIVNNLHLDLTDPDILIQAVATVFDHSEVEINEEYDVTTDNTFEMARKMREFENDTPTFGENNR